MLHVRPPVTLGANTFTGNQTIGANLIFSGSARRVTGDFSNATRSSRVLFQTTTTNGSTTLGSIPAGTGAVGGFNLFGASDPDNASILYFQMAESATQQGIIGTSKSGTGTARTLHFYTNDVDRWAIDLSGNLVSQAAGQFIQGDLSNATHSSRLLIQSSTANGSSQLGIVPNGTAVNSGLVLYGAASPTNAPFGQLTHDGTNTILRSNANGSGTAGNIQLQIGTTTYWTLAANSLTLADATNITVNTSTGTKIGTGTTQKIGFWNVAPVAQYSTTGTATGFTAGGGTTATHTSTFTGNTGSTAYTMGDVVRALKLCGIMLA